MQLLLFLAELTIAFSVLIRDAPFYEPPPCGYGFFGWGRRCVSWIRRRTQDDLRKFNITTDENGVYYKLFAITDLDNHGQTETYAWSAITRNATLFLSRDQSYAEVRWDNGSDVNITSYFSYKGRGMEMSDLVEFDGRMLAPDDKTGIIYEIRGKDAIPWVILNSGPGNTTKGMKIEWMTLRGSLLYAGGHGTEYRNKDGTVMNEDSMWVKRITSAGEVEHINWKNKYKKLRNFAGYKEPGYLTHEAVQWSRFWQKWFFLPRKASKKIYNEKADEKKGTNILIAADPEFSYLELTKIGERDDLIRKRGYSAFAFVPGTNDMIMVALKTKEVSNEPIKSWITVFDIFGHIILPDQELSGDLKFEGLYFV